MNLINRFNDYFDRIEESLDSPQKVKWMESDDSLMGFFKVGNIKYRIECIKQIGNNYSYSFSFLNNEKWEYDLNNIGSDGLKVLSTIMYGIDYLYDTFSPNSIIFSAIDKSDTRKRLYKIYCDKFCIKNDYKLSNRGNEDMVMFILFNDKVSDMEKEEIFGSVKKIIEDGKL